MKVLEQNVVLLLIENMKNEVSCAKQQVLNLPLLVCSNDWQCMRSDFNQILIVW